MRGDGLMGKTYVGIDIGTNQLKFAVCNDSGIKQLAEEPVPSQLVEDGRIVTMDAMSKFLRESARKHQIKSKDAALVLPSSLVFSRRLTMPLMTKEQLKINLPYEFRDFITTDKDKYRYDYAVVNEIKNEKGEITHLDLMIAATLKSTIAEYRAMLRRAGFRLRIAAPVIFCYANLIRSYEKAHPADAPREYCMIDIGHTATRIHIFSGSAFEVTRIIDHGCAKLDTAIANELQIDEQTANSYKNTNYNDVLQLESCAVIYQNIAIEIMRAINYYWFDKPNSNLTDAYYCGGGAKIGLLLEAISATIGLQLHSIEVLMPDGGAEKEQLLLCPSAVGITQQ
jgi:type IV pilus assembly protein PilM